jgi:hypothetical protein
MAESLSKSLYSDSPKLGRDEAGKVKVHKGGEKKEEKASETDEITSGADGAVRDTTDRHAAERFTMHHEHIHERMKMHERHAMEHMRHKGHKGPLHDRHESELKDLHKEHEKEHKTMHERHEAELSGGTAGEEQQD